MRQATRPIPCVVCGQNHHPKYLSGLGSLGPAAFRNFVRGVYPHLSDHQQVCLGKSDQAFCFQTPNRRPNSQRLTTSTSSK